MTVTRPPPFDTQSTSAETSKRYFSKSQLHPMIPSPRIFLLLPSRIDTVRPTTPSPPTPRFSLSPPVLDPPIELMENECTIGFSKSESSSESDSMAELERIDRGCPYLCILILSGAFIAHNSFEISTPCRVVVVAPSVAFESLRRPRNDDSAPFGWITATRSADSGAAGRWESPHMTLAWRRGGLVFIWVEDAQVGLWGGALNDLMAEEAEGFVIWDPGRDSCYVSGRWVTSKRDTGSALFIYPRHGRGRKESMFAMPTLENTCSTSHRDQSKRQKHLPRWLSRHSP